jgi:hypothetical protein
MHACTIGNGSPDNDYIDNIHNEFSNKYKNNLKIEKILQIYFSIYKLMIISISCNFTII